MRPGDIPDEQIPYADPEAVVMQYAGWVSKIANTYAGFAERTGAVDVEDLVQAGNIGLLEAKNRYCPGGGASFLTYSAYHIRNEILRSLGYGKSRPELPVISLDQELAEDTDTTLLDTIPDPDLVPFDDAIIERETRDETVLEVRAAVQRLRNDKQREIITRCWLNGEKRAAVAADMGIKVRALQSVDLEGRHKLRRDGKLRQYAIPYFSTSLSRFRSTWTSVVEATVIWKEEHGLLSDDDREQPERSWSPAQHLAYMNRLMSKHKDQTP